MATRDIVFCGFDSRSLDQRKEVRHAPGQAVRHRGRESRLNTSLHRDCASITVGAFGVS
jgi:hypothetical protein